MTIVLVTCYVTITRYGRLSRSRSLDVPPAGRCAYSFPEVGHVRMTTYIFRRVNFRRINFRQYLAS